MEAGHGDNPVKPLIRTLRGEVLDRPPFWFMRQAGRYLPEYRALRAEAGSFLDLVLNPEFAIEVTLQPLRRFHMDAAILFSDILIVPYALGQSLAFLEGEGPVLDPIEGRSGLSRLDSDLVSTRIAPVLETVRGVRAALDSQTALIGFCGGVWTVASYMIAGRGGDDQAAAKSFAYRDNEGFSDLLECLESATLAYCLAQIEAGAEAIQIFESWASNLPEPLFERAVIAPTARLTAHIRERAPGIPVIGFPRGAGGALARYVERTGVDAVSLDTGVPLGWARETLPPSLALQGNLDPLHVVAGGEGMIAEARRIREVLQGRPHVFNLGHGFVPGTPVAHVEALADFLHRPL
ncbi:MAG: uroporphyrinogen decarboxylase [Rhodothalassiaceae bacterium]